MNGVINADCSSVWVHHPFTYRAAYHILLNVFCSGQAIETTRPSQHPQLSHLKITKFSPSLLLLGRPTKAVPTWWNACWTAVPPSMNVRPAGPGRHFTSPVSSTMPMSWPCFCNEGRIRYVCMYCMYCTYVLYGCMFVCMYHMYVCLYVCLYAASFAPFVLYLFSGSPYIHTYPPSDIYAETPCPAWMDRVIPWL